MRSYVTAGVALLLLPQFARADWVTPGFTVVPHHLIIEVGSDHSGYRFWLISERGPEPLELAPGKPCRIDGRDRTGVYRDASIIAVPTNLAEWVRVNGLWSRRIASEPPTGVLVSERIDFNASVPFYDSREEVVDTYRLELVPGERVELVWLGQNEGSRRVKAFWAAGGVFAVLGLVGTGYLLLRLAARASRAERGRAPAP
jgi:hypothetical protein